MGPKEIVVQPCGCIALPDDLATALGMVPGATLSVAADTRQSDVILRLVKPAPPATDPAPAACPIPA